MTQFTTVEAAVATLAAGKTRVTIRLTRETVKSEAACLVAMSISGKGQMWGQYGPYVVTPDFAEEVLYIYRA